MLTPATRLRLEDIIRRIADGEPVSLQDRIYVQKFADHDATVWTWLRQAQRRQRHGWPQARLDRFLDSLALGEGEEDPGFDPRRDDLGDWFSGAPHWIRRS